MEERALADFAWPAGILKRHGIGHLAFAGVTTEVCVQTTMGEGWSAPTDTIVQALKQKQTP